MNNSHQAVVDSNLAVYSVLALAQTRAAQGLLERLEREGHELVAPRLWRYEVTTTINKYQVDKSLDRDSVPAALSRALALVRVIDEDVALCQSALIWAERLGQRAAYDGFYLALAERLGAYFWTADERLASRAAQVGASWVMGLGAGSE